MNIIQKKPENSNKHGGLKAAMLVGGKIWPVCLAAVAAVGLVWWFGSHYYSSTSYIPAPANKILAASQVAPAAQPVQISIPAISVNTQIVDLGLTDKNTLDVPTNPSQVGWYTGSAVPGAVGAAVLVGHLDYWKTGAAIFWNLKKLKAGDLISIKKSDGSQVSFKVDSLQSYPQNAFPTAQVYGSINYPGLRLITCTGKFNILTQRYSDNLVVYASPAQS